MSELSDKFANAVRTARSPEELAGVFEVIGQQYLQVRAAERLTSESKKEIRDVCIAALCRLETDLYEWGVEFSVPPTVEDGPWSRETKRFRARVYGITKIEPTEALASFLTSRGLGQLVSQTIVINEAALLKEVRRGNVDIEDIRSRAVISGSQGFRIDEVKVKEEGEDE